MKIPERQEALDAIVQKYLTDPKPAGEPRSNGHAPELTDEAVISLCRKAKNAAKFSDLYDHGDASAHGSDQSSADYALIGILSFYTQNAAQIERLMRDSALERPKWNKKRGAKSYLRYSIDHALASVKESYSPPREKSAPEPEPEKSSSSENPLLAGRVLLGKAIQDGIEPPDELVPGVLIRGRVHQFFAGPGSGKTMLALGLAKQVIDRNETVVIFDMENATRIIGERMEELGVDPELLDRHLVYLPYPNLPLDADVRRAYEEILDGLKPALVIFDSWVNFLASAGLDENVSGDIASWSVAYAHPARKRDIAVMILDHVPYDASHARGSTRKKDEVDVQWKVVNTQGFHRESVGEIIIQRQKDREGWLPPSVKFSVGGVNNRIIFQRSDGTIEEDGEDGLTESARTALDILRASTDESGLTFGQWLNLSGLSKTTFRRAVNALKDRTLVRQEGEGGRYFPTEEGPRDPDPKPGVAPAVAPEPLGSEEVAPHTENTCKTAGPEPEWPQSGPTGPSTRGHMGPPPFKGGPGGPGSALEREGEKHADRRLTDEEAREVQRLIGQGMSQSSAREEVLGEEEPW